MEQPSRQMELLRRANNVIQASKGDQGRQDPSDDKEIR